MVWLKQGSVYDFKSVVVSRVSAVPLHVLQAMVSQRGVARHRGQLQQVRLVSVQEVSPALFLDTPLRLHYYSLQSPRVVRRIILQDVQVGKHLLVNLVYFSRNVLKARYKNRSETHYADT
ncbi:hypothetical protein J6590_030449 [Homalodisca vitripennis]|nr:hypothetical protein J6590_030449 [Homalodisca vitripennis]